MSFRNTLKQKAIRRVERAQHAADTRGCMPFHGVQTTKKIVIGQRYNAVHGMPFSLTIAAVHIAATVKQLA